MKAAMPGAGLLLRFIVSGMTAFFVMAVMSMAVGFVATGASVSGGAGGLTGSFVQTPAQALSRFYFVQILAGMMTFFGSLYVLSKKKK
jgi:hypothetical protein